MVIAVGTKPPETTIAYDKPTPSPRTEVNAVHYKETEDRWTQNGAALPRERGR